MPSTPLSLMAVEIDGASWSVLDPLLAAGRMPHLRRLMRSGSHGTLRAVGSMMSPVAWTTLWTGTVAEKHGIRDFLSRADLDLRRARLWEILKSRLDWRCGLLDCFLTWPPDPSFDGFVIPNSLALDHRTVPERHSWFHAFCNGEDHTMAERLGGYLRLARGACRRSVLARLLWLQARGRFAAKDSRRLAIDRLLMFRCELQAEFFLDLLAEHRPRFAVLHLHAVDSVQHYFWGGPEVAAAYEAFDRSLGRVLSRAGPDAWVTVLSDHGAQAAGLLHGRRLALERVLGELGWDRRGLSYFNAMGTAPETRVRSDDPGWLARTAALFESARWSPGGSPVFSVQAGVDGPDRMSLRYEVPADGLDRCVEWPQTGVRLPAGRVFVADPLSGQHHPDGIWVLSGPGVRRDHRFEPACAVDVAPTLLRLLCLPAARDMDGAARVDLLEGGAGQNRAGAAIDSYGPPPAGERTPPAGPQAMADVRRRLRSMGYLE